MLDETNPRAAPGWDRETLVAVIRTYELGQRGGLTQADVERNTMAAFMTLHPEVPRSEAGRIVPQIIA